MAIGDPYFDEDDLKRLIGITDPSEDVDIRRACAAATRAINNKAWCSTFWNTGVPVTRTVEVYGRVVPNRRESYLKVLLPDAIASATITVAGQPKAAAYNAGSIDQGMPITALRLPITWAGTGTLDITTVWGWPEVPDDIVMAAQLQSHRYYKRRGSPEGIAGSAEWGMVRVPRLDPDVISILENGGYMNPGMG